MGESIIIPFAGNSRMSAALEAALSAQAPSVAVGELKELTAKWSKLHHSTSIAVCVEDLSNLISKAGLDE